MQKQSIKSRALKCENKPISVSFTSPRRKKRQYSRVEWSDEDPANQEAACICCRFSITSLTSDVVVVLVFDCCPTRPAATSGGNVSGRGNVRVLVRCCLPHLEAWWSWGPNIEQSIVVCLLFHRCVEKSGVVLIQRFEVGSKVV